MEKVFAVIRKRHYDSLNDCYVDEYQFRRYNKVELKNNLSSYLGNVMQADICVNGTVQKVLVYETMEEAIESVNE